MCGRFTLVTEKRVLEPVSYTHLDVYKRQGLKLEEQLKDVARHHGIRFLGPNCIGLVNSAISLNITAVSYTHLDVYKRQGQDRPRRIVSQVRRCDNRGVHLRSQSGACRDGLRGKGRWCKGSSAYCCGILPVSYTHLVGISNYDLPCFFRQSPLLRWSISIKGKSLY